MDRNWVRVSVGEVEKRVWSHRQWRWLAFKWQDGEFRCRRSRTSEECVRVCPDYISVHTNGVLSKVMLFPQVLANYVIGCNVRSFQKFRAHKSVHPVFDNQIQVSHILSCYMLKCGLRFIFSTCACVQNLTRCFQYIRRASWQGGNLADISPGCGRIGSHS